MTSIGVQPRAIAAPQSIDELAQCVGELYARDTPFAFAGGGTQTELGNLPRALDTLVKTDGCKRVVEYASADQTITVEGGMTIADIDRALAPQRQFLALDALEPERTTIGGAVATNLFGPRRLRYGSIRDLIVGVEVVRPDGKRARGGGKVVKNVAGFDMPKLMVGSLGTLGAVVSATFRVHPVEEHRAAVDYAPLAIDELMQLCAAGVAESLVPTAVVAYAAHPPARYACSMLFDGFSGGVEAQVQTACAIGARLGADAHVREVASAAAAIDERERAARSDAAWRITICARPTELARFLGATPLPAGARCALYPLLGVAFIAVDACDPATIARWRAVLEGGTVVVGALPADARAQVDSWGEPSAAALTIMRRLKANFDPKGLCNAGRFVGGI